MRKEDLKNLMRLDERYLIAGMLAVYAECDEGFTDADESLLTNLSECFIDRGFLSTVQLKVVRKKVIKYAGQIRKLGDLKPVKIKEDSKRAYKSKMSATKTAVIGNGQMLIRFPYDIEITAEVKRLAGRVWDAAERQWVADLSLENAEFIMKTLKPLGFECSQIRAWKKGIEATWDVALEQLDIKGLKKPLYPFQGIGVAFVQVHNGRAIIGDDMGLGKTPQALAYLQLNKKVRPAVVLEPACAKMNWAKEALNWLEDCKENRVFVCIGMAKNRRLCEAYMGGDGRVKLQKLKGLVPPVKGIILCNYDILANKVKKTVKNDKKITTPIPNTGWEDVFFKMNAPTYVTDECHYYANTKALRTKAVIRLGKRCKNFIPLSGTLIVNRPIEAFNALNIVSPSLFAGFFKYAERYCDMHHTGFGWDFTGSSNEAELHKKMSNIMIRRTKAEVLPELPPKMRNVVLVELDNRAEYDALEAEFDEMCDNKQTAAALVRIEKLKQCCIQGKMGGCIQWIDDFLLTGQKLVTFTTHTAPLDQICTAFEGKTVRVDGSVPSEKRQDIVEDFQTNDDIRLFAGNLKAAGVAITLTAAADTATLELGHHPGGHDQAEDRVLRIGQEADSVNAWYLLAADTVEEEIAEMIDDKRKIISRILDGVEPEEEALLRKLLDKPIGMILIEKRQQRKGRKS